MRNAIPRACPLAVLAALGGCATNAGSPGKPWLAQTPDVALFHEASGAFTGPTVIRRSPAQARGGNDRETDPRGFILLTPASLVNVGEATVYIPGDSYTRLVITALNGSLDQAAAADPEVYPYRKRSPIERFFVGTRHSATLSAKVSSGPFVATVPLLTVTHDSTRKDGEVFDRSIRHEASAFPTFLVGHNASSDKASVLFELKGNDKIESSAAGSALSATLDKNPGVKLADLVGVDAAMMTAENWPA